MGVAEVLYGVCVLLLSLYGANSLVLIWLFLRHRDDSGAEPLAPETWPHVTVQLPIYNELHIVERLLTAAARLDYPGDRLEIQVLDDSTDETRRVASQTVARLRAQGTDIVHIVRPNRAGYKAGALAAGLDQAKGELIAMFDADFDPPAVFLRNVVPHFADSAVGCVQTRWGHLNRDYSPFTRAQALGVDGHFVVEQTARSRSGMFVNFNGSAGVWRRRCIDDAGGWQGDTLTEDLDLSYRAQLRGWRIAYLPDVIVPAELPAQISGFKRQQARWAQGSIQTALKLVGPLLRSKPALDRQGGGLHPSDELPGPPVDAAHGPLDAANELLPQLASSCRTLADGIGRGSAADVRDCGGRGRSRLAQEVTLATAARDAWDGPGPEQHAGCAQGSARGEAELRADAQVCAAAAGGRLGEQRLCVGRGLARVGGAVPGRLCSRPAGGAAGHVGLCAVADALRGWLRLRGGAQPRADVAAAPMAGRAAQASNRKSGRYWARRTTSNSRRFAGSR